VRIRGEKGRDESETDRYEQTYMRAHSSVCVSSLSSFCRALLRASKILLMLVARKMLPCVTSGWLDARCI